MSRQTPPPRISMGSFYMLLDVLLWPPDAISRAYFRMVAPPLSRERSVRRMAIVRPCLTRLRLTCRLWAKRASVGPEVVFNYVDGRTSMLAPAVARRMAEAIGLSDLPE